MGTLAAEHAILAWMMRRSLALASVLAAVPAGVAVDPPQLGARVAPETRALPSSPSSCPVTAHTCSIHPCVEFVDRLTASEPLVLMAARPQMRPATKCNQFRSATAQRVFVTR